VSALQKAGDLEMMDEKAILKTLRSKIKHAKQDDSDFVYVPVWQAKELVDHFTPLKPKKKITGYNCPKCNHKLVCMTYYHQKHCDECGQIIDWTEVPG
jgi:hypothetical protein